MPSFQFATVAIPGRKTQWESGEKVTFEVECTGANTTTANVHISCPAFAQNPEIVSVGPSKSTSARKVKVEAVINAEPGTYTATLVNPIGGTLGTRLTATITIISKVTVEFSATPILDKVKPPYEPGDLVTLVLKVVGSNKADASVEISCPAFTRNPVVVKIPAAGRLTRATREIEATPVLLKGSAGTFPMTLENPGNCTLQGTNPVNLVLIDPVKVSFATPGFVEGASNLKPEQSVKLKLEIDRPPKTDLKVTINCEGFGKSSVTKSSLNPFTFEIKKGHPLNKPLEESINLVKQEGHYQAEIVIPRRYVLGPVPVFPFDIGPKRMHASLSATPFGPNAVLAKDAVLPLQIELSEPPTEDITLTVKCPTLEPASHTFKIPKNTVSPFETKQKFKLLGDPGLHRIELEAKDTILKNPVDILPGFEARTFKLPFPPGIPDIEFANPAFARPTGGAASFAPGDTVRFFVQFNRELTKPSPLVLACEAFPLFRQHQNRVAAIRIEKGRSPEDPPVIEATLREDIDFQNNPTVDFEVTMLARATDFNVLDPGGTTTITIRNYATAAFPARLPIKPASPEGYDPGTQITFRVELSEAASQAGATAVLESAIFATSAQTPTGQVAVKWEAGRTIAMVDARILTSQIDVINGGEYEVKLIGPVERCALSDDPLKLLTIVKIRPLPILSFRDAWIDPATTTTPPPPPKPTTRQRSGPPPQPTPPPQPVPTVYRVGQFVTLQFELTAPAPAIGAQFLVESALFNEPIKGEFVAGEQYLKMRVMLQKPSTGGPTDITITPVDPVYGCVLSATPSDLVGAIEVLPAPNVKFSLDWITPKGVSEYAEGSEVELTVELDAPAPEDAYARISSTAFGGKSYIVQFPKGSMSQGAIVQTGKQDHPEKLLRPLLTTRGGKGLVGGVTGGFGVDKTVKPLEKSVKVLLKLGYLDRVSKTTRVQKITVTPIRGCGGSDIKDIYVKPNLRRKINDPVAPCPLSPIPVEPPKHCNLHRMIVQEYHGKSPAKRGHDGSGSYEIVVSDAAPKVHIGAVVSPMRIQMIAGKVIYTVDDKPFHSTSVKIFADRKDYFCDDLFPHLDRKDRNHPHVTVLQRKPYRLEALLAGGGPISQMWAFERLELPEYPGWVAINPEAEGFSAGARLMKWHKIEKQEPTAPNAKLGNPLWEVKLKKRKQGFDKMLTKGIAALTGKDELVFTDDDEALAEAKNLGVDTSDLIGGLSLGTLLQSIMTIWTPRLEQYQVILESCGDPDPNKPTPKLPASRLVAMIEVYPSDEFCFFCNVTPVPAMQFGNDGQYMDIHGIKDNEAANKQDLRDDMPAITNAPGQLENALSGVTNQNLGPLSGSILTNPITAPVTSMENMLGGQRPAENYASDEISGTRNTVGQMQSHGGGQVHDHPEFGGVSGDGYGTKFAQLSLKPSFTYLTTGSDGFELRRKDGLATPPRYPAPTPETRVFHQVYENDLFGVAGATGDITRDWNIAKIGLVVNGNPKPQFSPAAMAVYGLLYCIRHWSDFWRAMQEMVPSWGWGVTFDLGFLEGGMRMRWGWKEYEDWQVFRWWQLEISCNLFRIMIELWAGFRARALFVKFEFVAFLKITGILGVKASIERTGPSPREVAGEFQLTDHKNDKKFVSWNADLTASTTAEVGLRMVLFNDGFLKATGSIKTGYLFKFKFKEPIEGSIGLTLEGYFLGVSVKLIVQAVGLKKYIQREKVLIEGTPDGRPHFRRILFPKGSHGQKTPWKVKDQLELIWQKVSAQVARLDEALNDWYKIQLDLVLRRDKEEFAVLSRTNPRAEWPWTEDPGVSIQLTPTGYAMKTSEDDLWRQQWKICREALLANQVVAIWDVFGHGEKGFFGKTNYKKSHLTTIPKVGKTLHKKMKPCEDLAAELIKYADKAEFGIEMVKNALATINTKYISTLQKIDEELERFADEDLKVSEEVLKLIDEAKDWALWGVHSEKLDIDTRGTVRGLVEDALEEFDIEKLAKLAYQVDRWTVGGSTLQPKLFATVDSTPVTTTPGSVTLWIGGVATTIDITNRNHLVGLRNAINELNEQQRQDKSIKALDKKTVIASIESSGRSFYLVLAPERPNMGKLAVSDSPTGTVIAGRK